MPFDAHSAKSLLTKNDFLAKLIVLFGLHEYILFVRPEPREYNSEASASKSDKKKKEQTKILNERSADMYVDCSFIKDFKVNNRDIELFEAPKILGDIFESLMGAIFIDGGIEEVIKVYQHLLAPFVLYVAKYSKKLNKEAKEDFVILSGLCKIKPELVSRQERYYKVSALTEGRFEMATQDQTTIDEKVPEEEIK